MGVKSSLGCLEASNDYVHPSVSVKMEINILFIVKKEKKK